MQHVLQAGLSLGMSATSGLHSKKPPPVDPSFDGLSSLLPMSFVPTAETKITLRGKHHNVSVPYLCWGAWSWGDKATWHWDDARERPALKEAWQIAVQNGMNFIDTAQAYGSGESERICAELFKGMPRDSYVIQTKWYVVPDNMTNLLHPTEAPVKMLRKSLERCGLEYMDCYLVHGHIHASSISQVAKGLAECVDQGLTKTVGVANYSTEDMIKMADELAKYGIPLATNQCEFSILRRHPETHGLLQACKDRGIVFQSYSSLAQGRLTGKYNASHEPPKTYRFSSYPMQEIEPTLEVLASIAKRRGVTVPGVALNYNVSKGVLPVAGVRNPEQAKSTSTAWGWRLSEEEIRQIDAVSFDGKSTVLWQQG
ncbi:hypothetical protein LTR66_005457 [Elasticomyces elasticus]|nr:hypothetical protein LTR66_005457 [Elasticomyces elasticus]